ncbi:two-component sensor histidine kinase [Sediminibacillus dalangtanensis]|uniref:histidine kinase n=1 Tax=Sediminibacillus dalangtanensis TaxID=2729421 RepID=A0ABX7VZC7_9BACI|nr:HAMP domain-containing sensor histidine kinase [Sediminibacillus dalangtanensis]QTN01121.1 two-component sensor histidine kinase [Sediminibacillus dalangtanensis]
MKRSEFIKRRILPILAVTAALLIGWSCAYWLTSPLYDMIGYHPHGLTKQLINSILGFLLFGFAMHIFSRTKWMRKNQEKFLHPIIQAMKMMAEGNFKIDLSFYQTQFQDKGDHPYSRIVESISHMADKLGEMEEMRQEFISNVSHEIQSPLTSISGFAHALKNKNLSQEERDHYLQIIETESYRLSKLSENLLKLTSLESEHLALERKEYRLDHQLRCIILANEPQWVEKEITMDVSLDNVTLRADEELMDQVWTNLLHNSIKFTPTGGTIEVQANNISDNRVEVRISDTGIGMEKDTLMHLFERFYKADKARNRNAGGSGLGLSIVKKIIELHNGQIHVASEPGEGTEITVELVSY